VTLALGLRLRQCRTLARIVGALLAGASALVLLSASGLAESDGWTLVGNEHAIAIYRRDVPGSGIVALKGEGVIDAPVWKVASILLDTRRAPEWVDDLTESRVVRQLRADAYIEYNHLHLPLFIKDREFVSEVRIEVDQTARSVTLVYRPTDSGDVPASGNVRGQIRSGLFRARSRGEGQGTDLLAELDCDPRGAIPAWVVNLFQKSWPRNTFEGIRRQIAKPDITMPEAFKSTLMLAKDF
jgi:hypothetical protein